MTGLPVVAGGVVVGVDGQIVLACQQGRSWSLPKGHLEPGEQELDGARREIAEECGIRDLKLVAVLGEYVRSALGSDGMVQPGNQKLIKMFLFVSSHGDGLQPADPDNPLAIWSPLAVAPRLLTHPADAEFLLSSTDKIRELAPITARLTRPDLPRHTAIVLAAGVGSRLAPLTKKIPKCLTRVGGEPLLSRSLDALSAAGIESFVIVVGHLADQVIEEVTRRHPRLSVRFARNPDFHRGTASSLRCGLEHLDPCDALVLVEGDVVFDHRLPRRLFTGGGSTTAVERYRPGLSGTFMRRDAQDVVTEISHATWRGADADQVIKEMDKTVNVHAFCHSDQVQIVMPVLDCLLERAPNANVEDLLRDCVSEGLELRGVDMDDLPWCEVDDEADLAVANRLFGASLMQG